MLLHVWLAISATALAPQPPLRRTTTRLHARHPQRRPRAVDSARLARRRPLLPPRRGRCQDGTRWRRRLLTRPRPRLATSRQLQNSSLRRRRRRPRRRRAGRPLVEWSGARVACNRRVWERRPGTTTRRSRLTKTWRPRRSRASSAEPSIVVSCAASRREDIAGRRAPAYTVDAAGDEKYVRVSAGGRTTAGEGRRRVRGLGRRRRPQLRTDATGRPHEVCVSRTARNRWSSARTTSASTSRSRRGRRLFCCGAAAGQVRGQRDRAGAAAPGHRGRRV